MKVWEAHKQLADASGDTADITADDLFDGVRYTKAERDAYLYQALISVFSKLVTPMLRAPRKQLVTLVNRYFPNMIVPYSFQLNITSGNQIHIHQPDNGDGYFNPLVVLELYIKTFASNGANLRGIPIPFKTSDQVAELTNSRTSFKPDLFFTYFKYEGLPYGTIQVHDYQGELADIETEINNLTCQMLALNYPKHPSLQLPDDDLNIEESYVDMVINKAIIFMMRDDQEIEGIERVMPLIEPFTQQGG